MPRHSAKSTKAKKQRTSTLQGFSSIQSTDTVAVDGDHSAFNDTEEYYSEIVNELEGSCLGVCL
jgi:hypothetical protein